MRDNEKSRPVTVVTGAAGGIGRVLVDGLLEAGHDVLAVVRRAAPDLSPSINKGRCDYIEADLAFPEGRSAVVQAVSQRFGGLWCLINNAGVGMGSIRRDYYKRPIELHEIGDAVLARFMAINAEAPIALSLALLPYFRNHTGRIINIGTSLTAMHRAGFIPYAMSKAALESGSAVLAKDLQDTAITVNTVHPGGPVDTPMARRAEPSLRANLLAPETMVAPICWLAGPDSSSHHGQRLNARYWREDEPHAGWDPIGWSQLATDSAWDRDTTTS